MSGTWCVSTLLQLLYPLRVKTSYNHPDKGFGSEKNPAEQVSIPLEDTGDSLIVAASQKMALFQKRKYYKQHTQKIIQFQTWETKSLKSGFWVSYICMYVHT